MKNILLLLITLLSFVGQSQSNWDEFTGKQKAFFYQLTRKVENMEPQVFHLFEFTDSIPYINDTLPDYPYVEKQIVNDSTKLKLHYSEFYRKNNGIVSDIATHYASWELDLILQFRKSTKPQFVYLKEKMKVFEHFVVEKAPQNAVKSLSNGNYELSPSVAQYFSPNLSINEKIAAIKNSSFSDNDQLLIIRAIYYAQEKYILKRSKEIFKILGGEVEDYQNFLVAAGDGDNWSDLEGDMRTKYNRALPDPKSLFKFETELKKDKKTKKDFLDVKATPIKRLSTKSDAPTKVHVDVWGYHPERQTTVVIQKGGNSYILYGNNENRYVSPDSSYELGSTYWRLINELENVHIAELKEMIYGKRGFDYWIAEYESKIESTQLQIKKSEIRLDAMRYTTTGPPKMKKNKQSKKSRGFSDQDNQGHPTGKLTGPAKKKNIEQKRLIALNSQLEEEKRTLKQLKIDKEKAFDVLAEYETQLDKMLKNVGHTFVEFKRLKNGNYLFTDGTTFNYLEQDLTFQEDNSPQSFEIITLAFGEKVFSTKLEESFIHYNITYPKIGSKHTLFKEIDSKNVENKISVSDSIQIIELFWALAVPKIKLNISAIGGGIANGETKNYFRDSLSSVAAYDKEKETKNTIYNYKVSIDNTIDMSITTYRHNMLPFQFNQSYGKYYSAAKLKNPSLNEIDFYTTLLSNKRIYIWLEQLTNLASIWLIDDEIQSVVLNKLKSAKVNNVYSLSSSEKIKLPKK
jgi:hypothetical protein